MGAGRALIATVVLLAVAGCTTQTPPAADEPAPTVASEPSHPPTRKPPRASPSPTPTGYPQPDWATHVAGRTTQVIRTVSSDRWCREVHCTITQAWERGADGWRLVREFRSSIAPSGWGKEAQDDLGTPEGVFAIKITFSTSASAPGPMPWRRRLPTSNVTDEDGPNYNTWIEEPGRTDGDRPSMRWGFVVDFNNVRLEPGVGPAPVPDGGSGIFYHTSRPGKEWEPTEGCTQVGNPADMRWLLTWLRPGARPRVVQNI